MSKDIRSYFLKASGSSSTRVECEFSENKKRNRRVIESDDENDDFIALKKKPKELLATSKSSFEKNKSEVIVEVESFFEKRPVRQKKQTFTTKINTEEKKEESFPNKQKKSENKNLSELLFQNDDELEASLLQTDDEQLLSLENNEKGSLFKDIKTEPTEVENKTLKKELREKIGNSKKEVDGKKKTQRKEITLEIKLNKTLEQKQNKREPDNSLINSEQKKRNIGFQKFLQRTGPKNPGSKCIPKGTPICLQGLTFVITGILDSLEREEASELIQKCGGRVTSSVSKKTDYIVMGEEPGVSKIQKADNFGTKKISEDELLDLIRNKSGGQNVKKEKDIFVEGTSKKTVKCTDKKSAEKRFKKMDKVKDEPSMSKKFKTPEKKDKSEIELVPELIEGGATCLNKIQGTEKLKFKDMEKTRGDMLWVDKYRPKSTKNIIGQMGEKSNVKKLIKWLQNWHKNHSPKKGSKPARPAPWARNDDGSYYKAALLSGPPGVGKTTTAHLVCEELGLDLVEFNASDTRSKRLLQEEVSELLSTKSIRGFLQGSGESFQKHVLIMDEVDGMAGNEDRGGIQELIQLIKNTRVPIICICNDRNHPKMRSLVNYCFDLRFQRPRVDQIKGAMKSVCFKEKLDIPGEALEELIIASNHDVRQVLHTLYWLTTDYKTLTAEEAKKKGGEAKKPMNLSPWDVVRKVFSASEQEKLSFAEKTDLFFQDYSLGPLFVQDTYLRVKPYKANDCNKKKLELISKAADSLALGDVIERVIRSQNAWNLLPFQAVFSSVLPGHHMSGHVQGQVQFPVWLGKNSKSNKFRRLLQDLQSSLRISCTSTRESINLDYLSHLKNAIVKPLAQEGSQGVQSSLKFMLSYHLTKEDFDNILELSTWPEVIDLFSRVDSKVKAALTRALNKEGQVVVSKKKNTKVKDADDFDLNEEIEDVEEESDNIDLDPMIKIGKPRVKKGTELKGKIKEESRKQKIDKTGKK